MITREQLAEIRAKGQFTLAFLYDYYVENCPEDKRLLHNQFEFNHWFQLWWIINTGINPFG